MMNVSDAGFKAQNSQYGAFHGPCVTNTKSELLSQRPSLSIVRVGKMNTSSMRGKLPFIRYFMEQYFQAFSVQFAIFIKTYFRKRKIKIKHLI